jgi:cytochrome c peroxidase
MRRRALSLGWLACALVGCWSEEPRVDGFTDDQWAALQRQFKVYEPPAVCLGDSGPEPCDRGFELGQRLFFEPALSGTGNVSCVTCHDPDTWFVDKRRTPVSMGAVRFTQHNTISVVNLVYKPNFTWTGKCQDRACSSPESVIIDIALPKAMASSPAIVANVVRTKPAYAQLYMDAFGSLGGDDTITENVAKSLKAYMRQLQSTHAPFDAYIAGNATALSDSARRGFTLFVGKAMCAECHSGAFFTDGRVHVTGVKQGGAPGPVTDSGAGTTGGFLTPPLRHIAETAPYMHDGSLATLADVIELYRRGGDASGFTGEKDPLMQPLDITDDEAHDLEAFLKSLTGSPISSDLKADLRPVEGGGSGPTCDAPKEMCGTACVDTDTDAMNCGACGIVCPTNKPTCAVGTCVH